ncbi:MAG: U32 family peptidase [Lachnospiraceae bacterium]|nr:U32 family peptidase [Lachnospiraceae bacterium]
MPAGSLDVLKTAIDFGADAVYVGGDLYSLRAKAKNFSHEDMVLGVEYCRDHNKKLYVTVNITAHNSDLDGVRGYLKELDDIGCDGLIISDPGVFELAGEYAPHIERHISTQANNTNYLTYRFWYGLGAKRVVSARELSLAEIRQIRENIPDDMEIESFVHGAMCISYSGRCLLSNYLAGRDANLGECTHPCRWKYYLCEETRPGVYLPVEENERGTYIFNSKDLCMIDHIPELVDAGIDSFKIEGRMKTTLYAATVARAYRAAIDDYFTDKDQYTANLPLYYEEITKGTNRRFCTGFFFGKPDAQSQVYENSTYVKDYIYYGTISSAVREAGCSICTLEQKNKFSVGDTLEVVAPGSLTEHFVKVNRIRDDAGNDMDSCPHASRMITVDLEGAPAEDGNLLRGRA